MFLVYLEALANKEYIVSVVFHELIFSRCALVAAILFFAGADAFANQELKNPFINDATTEAQNASRTQGVRVGNAETISLTSISICIYLHPQICYLVNYSPIIPGS